MAASELINHQLDCPCVLILLIYLLLLLFRLFLSQRLSYCFPRLLCESSLLLAWSFQEIVQLGFGRF